MLKLACQSLWNRRFVAALTALAIGLSVALMLGVDRLRDSARQSFVNSVSGIDLIVAPRGNDVQILMATVFGLGSTGTGMRWDSFEALRQASAVDWAVPVMLGDTHHGHPVIGTQASYFTHYHHSGGAALRFAQGRPFESATEAVLGADVAARFAYELDTELVIAHGAGAVSFETHDDAPFSVSGVLAPTGTAVDRMVFVSLAGFDGLHAPLAPQTRDPLAGFGITSAPSPSAGSASLRWHSEVGSEAGDAAREIRRDQAYTPAQINGVFLGLKNRSAVLSLQRFVATYPDDALSAVMPNVALLQLWSITGTVESALWLMAVAVAVAGLIGMVVMLSAALEARRREFAILRAMGATSFHLFSLIVIEAKLIAFAGLALGVLVFAVIAAVVNPVLFAQFGVRLGLNGFGLADGILLLAIFCFAALASLLPAWRVYRMSLADGLTPRL